MISYFSGRARVSFDPPRTVLFVHKENQKNFRRMLRILKLPTALTNAASSTQNHASAMGKEQECE
ncbi:hypothetical protein [uncultured Rikenella sp.]|uniref:hypothetical protein n=1 Tax=uncultured Rikenella sp. TaxID=368003 RepID=UPI00261D3B89|nr:hypothetical protein [uncultured Rikenella sp.]